MQNITDIRQLSESIKQNLIKSPESLELDAKKRAVNNAEETISDYSETITNYRKIVQESIVKKARLVDELKVLKHRLAEFEKSISTNGYDDTKLGTLNIDNIEKFLSQTGFEFIGIYGNNTEGVITFMAVRKAGNLNYLPIPPLCIAIEYKFSSGVYALKSIAAIPMLITGTDTYEHPHIDNTTSRVCLGNYLDVMNENNIGNDITNWQDHFILLNNLLNTYNPDSPYTKINNIFSTLNSTGYRVNTDKQIRLYYNEYTNNFVMSRKTNKDKVYISEFLTLEIVNSYRKIIGDVEIKSLLEDTIAEISSMSHSGDTEEEAVTMYDYRNHGVFKEYLSCVGDYTHNCDEEDNDYRECLSEDSFEDLKDQWIADLRKADLSNFKLSIKENEVEEFFAVKEQGSEDVSN